MSDSVQMPALGESVTEGTVTRWLKAVGDTVAVDEPLLEVSTDKVDTEIPSPFAGVLEQTAWVIEGARGAARLLGLHPNTLRSRMKRWGLKRPGERLLAAV